MKISTIQWLAAGPIAALLLLAAAGASDNPGAGRLIAATPAEAPPPAPSAMAPGIEATMLSGKPVNLVELRGKPVVLEFGSITEPLFRARVPEVEKLAEKYAGRVTFIVVYQREAHAADSGDALVVNDNAGFGGKAPKNEKERIDLAKQAMERLKITHEQVAVDAWTNYSSRQYGAYPNMTFVIDGKGMLAAGYPWMDTKKVDGALRSLVRGEAVPPALRGQVRPSAPVAMDQADDALIASAARGVQGLGIILDRMDLAEAQKARIYPALGQFVEDLRDFRQKGARGADGKAAFVDGALGKLRASADRFQNACKTVLSDSDYKKIMSAIKTGPAIRRLFTDG